MSRDTKGSFGPVEKAKNTAFKLTLLTTRGISAVKTYRKNDEGKIEVEGYGKAKTFTAEVIDADPKGRWLKKLRPKSESFVVLGAPENWKPGEKKRRLSQDRDGAEATIKDVPRALMPIDIDQVDFEPMARITDGEHFAFELLDRLKIPKGTAFTWHLTGSHGFFGKYRARLWVELAEPMTCAQMKSLAKAHWGDEKVKVGGKPKNLVDFSVYQPQQPIYTGDPILLDGIESPVKQRVGHVDGEPWAVEALPRSKDGQEKATPEDENIAKLEEAGLYIRRLKPGQHCIRCPWEEMHSGAERDDDTFYFEPNYNGHDIPAYKCHHDSCAEKKWEDVLEHLGAPPGWVYVKRLHHFRDPRDGELVDIATYAAERRWSNDRQVVRRFLNEGGESVDRVEFLPGEERVVARRQVRTLNLYDRSQRVEPDDKMDDSPWVEQIEWMLPDERERELSLDWMAWAYQNPGRKINWAWVLYGPEGNGKTSVQAALAECIGKQYSTTPTTDDLKDRFNSWAWRKLLVRIEELMVGDDRYEVANRLKPVITNSTISVRVMHRNSFDTSNFANVCASTNLANSIPMSPGDRRYAIFSTIDDLEEIRSNKPRLLKLHRWLYQENGLRAVAAQLASRDVSEFDYAGQAPSSETKSIVIDSSMPWLDQACEAAKVLKENGIAVVTTQMLAGFLETCGIDLTKREKKLGEVAAQLKWMPISAAVGTKRPRIWVGSRQESVWSPTRSKESLIAFDRLSVEERAKQRESFINGQKWLSPEKRDQDGDESRATARGTVVPLRRS